MSASARCDYCGLPLAAAGEEPRYCCLGCRFAAGVQGGDAPDAAARAVALRLGLGLFFAMNVMVFTLALWTRDLYGAESGQGWGEAARLLHELFRYLCLLFSLPVLLLLGGPLAEVAIAELRQRRVTTDLLLLTGVVAAFAYSLVAVLRGTGHVYFEVVCMVLVAVTLGRWLEANGKLKTTRALRSLAALLPDRVRRVAEEGRAVETPAGEVRVGDRLLVSAGERVPLDARVLRGQAAIDSQAVSGESTPAIVEPGDTVYAGSLNLDGELLLEVTAAAGGTALDRLVDTVVAAAEEKETYRRLADRVSRWFLPAVVGVAALTCIAHTAWHGPAAGVLASLAVVLIACPCALALATPMAVWAAFGRASREGVVLRSGDALELLARARTFVFDKTGTLTTGEAEIEKVDVESETPRDEALGVAAALAATSTHPLATAIVRATGGAAAGVTLTGVVARPGRGVRATWVERGEEVILGSPRWLEELGCELPAELRAKLTDDAPRGEAADARPRCCLASAGRLRAIFTARERLRPEAAAALAALRDGGRRVLILSGDRPAAAEAIGSELRVEARGGLLPEEKRNLIEQLAREAGPVVMVGDGINDAPALARADVGVALGCGTDIAREAADVCLLSSDLARLPWSVELARRTAGTIRWNLLWALIYNTLGVGLAAAGWLNPIVAAVAMAVSSLLVVSNSLRLASDGDAAGGTAPIDDEESAGRWQRSAAGGVAP